MDLPATQLLLKPLPVIMGRKCAIETVTRLEERKMVMMILKLVMMIKNDHDVEDGVDDDDDDQ